MKFFEHLDKKGGFYYERWGDAPVHSIGAALFAKKEQIHFFNDIGKTLPDCQPALLLTTITSPSQVTVTTPSNTVHKARRTRRASAGAIPKRTSVRPIVSHQSRRMLKPRLSPRLRVVQLS